MRTSECVPWLWFVNVNWYMFVSLAALVLSSPKRSLCVHQFSRVQQRIVIPWLMMYCHLVDKVFRLEYGLSAVWK